MIVILNEKSQRQIYLSSEPYTINGSYMFILNNLKWEDIPSQLHKLQKNTVFYQFQN